MPLKEAVGYVAAAYIAVFLIVLIYVAIMSVRVRRTERELADLLAGADAREETP
jgi:CcmD family protein